METDAAQDVGEPSLRVDAIELGGADQGVDRRRALAATIGTREQPRLPAEGNTAQRALAALFDRQIRPSSRKRVKAGQRLSM